MTPHLLDLEKCVPLEVPSRYFGYTLLYMDITIYTGIYFAKLYRSGMPYP
jgi:hypothetical protein